MGSLSFNHWLRGLLGPFWLGCGLFYGGVGVFVGQCLTFVCVHPVIAVHAGKDNDLAVDNSTSFVGQEFTAEAGLKVEYVLSVLQKVKGAPKSPFIVPPIRR